MDIGGFREEHGHLFNWGILELLKFCRGEECKVITAPKEAYEHFCGPADSHNTDRVIDVIKSLL